MEIIEILDEIEEMITGKESSQNKNSTETEDDHNKTQSKSTFHSIVSFLISFLKLPFQLIARLIKNEIITAIKKEAKLLLLVSILMGVLFVFFIIIWLSISLLVGFYFYENGNTILLSVIYSIAFQFICFIFVTLIVFIASKKLKSIKLLRKL